LPAGKALPLVRGFNRSILASAIRLNAIAQFLALNIAIRIHTNLPKSGIPSAAIKALITAKGRANTVCSILISVKIILIFLKKLSSISS
jgi:hypothetical protein